MWPSARIGSADGSVFHFRLQAVLLFDKYGVVTYEQNGLVIDVDHVFSEHFPGADFSGPGDLLADVFNETGRAGHDIQPGARSVPKMPDAREDHRQPVLIGGCDDLFVAHGAAGLNDGNRARGGQYVHAVAEGKEGVRRNHGAF